MYPTKCICCICILREDTHTQACRGLSQNDSLIHNLGHSVSGISFSRWFLMVEQNIDLSAKRNLKS